MKPILATLVFVLFFGTFLNAQNAPSINIKNNSFSSQNLDRKNDRYRTLNYIDYTRDSLKVINLRKQIDTIYNLIAAHDDNTEPVELRNLYNQKKKELNTTEIAKDSLWNEYMKDELENDKVTWKFGKQRSKALFDLVYNDDTDKRFNLLNNTGFNIGRNTGSIYSELVSGQMYVFRVSLGAMISSSSSDSLGIAQKEEAFQRLSTYGGNTVLMIEYPLFYGHTKNNQAVALTRIIGKGTADFPEFGTTSDDWAGSASLGLDVYADVATSNNKIRFFTNLNMSYYMATGTFQQNLEISDDKFSFGQLKVGLTFSNVSLSFIISTFSSESVLRNRSVIAGGQILH